MTDHTAGIFESELAFDETPRVAGRRAVAVAVKRAQDRFGAFLASATDADRHARFDLIDDDLKQVVADVVAEYGGDVDRIERSIISTLAAGGYCDECKNWKSGPKAGCTCDGDGGDESSDESPEDDSKESRTARWTVVAEALETVDLPTGDDTALDGPSPEMDEKTWKPNALNPDGNLSPIDSEGTGSPNPTTTQDVTDVADHSKEPFEQIGEAVTERQDVGKEGDIERIHTDTWSGQSGQADPVTSSAQDPDRNPLRDMMENGILPQLQVEAAIERFENGPASR